MKIKLEIMLTVSKLEFNNIKLKIKIKCGIGTLWSSCLGNSKSYNKSVEMLQTEIFLSN